MSRTPPKKSTHLKKKLELVPLPMSQQRDKSDRKGVFNSFFTDDEFNRLRYHSCIYSLLNAQFLAGILVPPMTTGFENRKDSLLLLFRRLLRKIYGNVTHVTRSHFGGSKRLFPRNDQRYHPQIPVNLFAQECFTPFITPFSIYSISLKLIQSLLLVQLVRFWCHLNSLQKESPKNNRHKRNNCSSLVIPEGFPK